MKRIFRNIVLWLIFIVGILASWYQTLYTVVACPTNEGSIFIPLYNKEPFYWYRDFFGFIVISMILVALYTLIVMKIIKIPEKKLTAHKHFKAYRILRAELIYIIVPAYFIIAFFVYHDFP